MTYRFLIADVAFALVVLTCHAHGQAQDVPQPYKEWLNCDVSWILTEAITGSDFSLEVSFHGAPIVGTKIELRKSGGEHGGDVVAASKTDSHGVARFRAVPAGEYYAKSAGGVLFPSTSLKVEAKNLSLEKETVEWPEHVIAVRNLRGRFNISEESNPAELPLRGASVALLNVYTGRSIESTLTDVNGDFEFATRDPGIYALRLTLPKKDEAGSEDRELAIVVDPTADQDSILEMKAVQTECNGLQLSLRSRSDGQWVEF